MPTTNANPRKNITIALSEAERRYVGELKSNLMKKNFTQVFLFLLDFYRDNVEFITEHESTKINLLNDFTDLKELVEEMQKNNLSREDGVSIKLFIDNIQELKTEIALLSNRLDLIENASIGPEELVLLNDKMEKLSVEYDEILTKVAQGQAAVEEIKEIKSLIKNLS